LTLDEHDMPGTGAVTAVSTGNTATSPSCYTRAEAQDREDLGHCCAPRPHDADPSSSHPPGRPAVPVGRLGRVRVRGVLGVGLGGGRRPQSPDQRGRHTEAGRATPPAWRRSAYPRSVRWMPRDRALRRRPRPSRSRVARRPFRREDRRSTAPSCACPGHDRQGAPLVMRSVRIPTSGSVFLPRGRRVSFWTRRRTWSTTPMAT